MKRYRCVLALVAVFFSVCAIYPTAFASNVNELRDESKVLFSDLSAVEINERIEQRVIDTNGNEAIVGIERIEPGEFVRSSDSTWRVWFTGVTINAEFYMTVSNNRVMRVYDETISIFGGTYTDKSLMKTTTYGKLTFKVTSIAGLVSGQCWLKGTVVGSDNDIEVSWQM